MRYAVLQNYYAPLNVANRAFDKSAYKIGANLHKWADSLRQYLLIHQISLNTLDSHPESHPISAVIFFDFPAESDEIGQRLLDLNVPKFLVTCESPIIRPQNFFPKNTEKFTQVFTYNLDKIDGNRFSLVQPYGFSHANESDFVEFEFSERRFLCAMAGNKVSSEVSSLYSLRQADFEYFATLGSGYFSLYGKGWSSDLECYKGVVGDKIRTLRQYKYSLCYENTAARSWYLSEKLFEVMQGGCVPVYAGPAEIENILPRGAIVFRSDFGCPGDLCNYLMSIRESEFYDYLDRARDWMRSPLGMVWQVESNTKALAAVVFAEVYGAKPIEVRCNSSVVPSNVGHRSSQKKSICLVIGLGDELPVYQSTRHFWESMVRELPENVRIFFVKSENSLPPERVELSGNVASVGIGNADSYDSESIGYAKTGVWSSRENFQGNVRNATFLNWLLSSGESGDITLQTTLTSFIDLKALAEFSQSLSTTGLYGGTVKCGRIDSLQRYFSFTSGANTYMSRDVLRLYLNRLRDNTELLSVPNDLLAGYLLGDIPRCGVPFFTFDLSTPRDGRYVADVLRWGRKLGFFHFRIKSLVMNQFLRDQIDSGIWLNSFHHARDAIDNRDSIALSLRYRDALTPALIVPSAEGYVTKLSYYRSSFAPMFFSQIVSH
jgi:hypothetical protein